MGERMAQAPGGERCTYRGWYVDAPFEPVRMAATGAVDRTDLSGIDLAEFRCTEPALADGRCSVHLDVGEGPGG